MKIHEYCRAWRMQKGLKQREIAEMIGKEAYQISGFENGKRRGLKLLLAYIYAGMSIDASKISREEVEKDD